MLCNKLSRSSSLIYQLRNYLPIHILKKLYYAHVYPHINYCNSIWSNTFPTHLQPLVLIHKRIIRNIAKSDFLEHTQPLYHSLKILNIDNIRKLNLSILLYKQTRTNEFAFSIFTQNHAHNTRNRDLLVVPPHRTTLHANSFHIQAVRLWNHLPQDIKNSQSLHILKKKMNKFLLSDIFIV